jgi:hypothetical protein
MRKIISTLMMVFVVDIGVLVAHDTTHIHPLISAKIAELIQDLDTSKAYSEIYEPSPNPDPDIPPEISQLLYWGTDFDPVDLAAETTEQAKREYLVDDRLGRYTRNNNVIDGVVFEDNPAISKVRHHFYQANTGIALTVPILGTIGDNSAVRAMNFYNQSIEKMGHYGEASKQEAFFLFGQSLHLVEDMMAPAHIHNDAENALFVPILCYGASQNTHVAHSTLRFFEAPRLALKPTEHFHRFTL